MYNEILDAVMNQLKSLFGPEYGIYTGAVGPEIEKPCFSVQFLASSEKPMIGSRYYRRTDLLIQYFPSQETELLREFNRVTEVLMNGMEYITLADGKSLRGTERSAKPEMSEKRLEFMVSYNTFVNKTNDEEETMQTMEIKKGLVK